MEDPRRPTTSTTKTHSRLLLRVHSAKGLPHTAFSQGMYCKLYVGDTPMTNGSQKSLFHTEGHENNAEDGHATHRIFRTTTVAHPDDESPVVWDENFDVAVMDASKEILSIRVKSKHRLYSSVLGVCAIQLKQMKEGRKIDKWVPLLRGQREVASLRLQVILSPLVTEHKDRHGAQADIQIALAANHAADDAIERLLAVAQQKKTKTERDLAMARPATTNGAAPVYSA